MTPEQFFTDSPDALHVYQLIAAVPAAQQFDCFADFRNNAAWQAEENRVQAHNTARQQAIADTAVQLVELYPHPETRARLRFQVEGKTLSDWDLQRTVQAVFEAAAELASEGQREAAL